MDGTYNMFPKLILFFKMQVYRSGDPLETKPLYDMWQLCYLKKYLSNPSNIIVPNHMALHRQHLFYWWSFAIYPCCPDLPTDLVQSLILRHYDTTHLLIKKPEGTFDGQFYLPIERFNEIHEVTWTLQEGPSPTTE